MIKYEKELTQILREGLYETWMTEDEYQECLRLTLSVMNTDIQKLSDQVQIGVDNGHSAEFQMKLIKQLMKKSGISESEANGVCCPKCLITYDTDESIPQCPKCGHIDV